MVDHLRLAAQFATPTTGKKFSLTGNSCLVDPGFGRWCGEATSKRRSNSVRRAPRPVYTFPMELDLDNKIFPLPNARRLIVERFGVRITDKNGRTILESGAKKEVCFDRSLSKADRRLLSGLK